MLREIKTFLAIQRHGTFASTAEQLGMTQSAVSAQIKTLEQQLGFKLFDRSRRGAVLNEAGERVLPYAEQMVALLDQMMQTDSPKTLTGNVNLGAIDTVQTGLFPKLLPYLREEAPQLNVSITQGVSYDLLGEVGAGRLDMAFVIRPPFELSQDFVSETVMREPYVLLAGAEVEGDIAEILAQHPFIRYNHASFGGQAISQFLKQKEWEVNEILASDDLEAVVQFVKHGMGVALVPQSGLWVQHLTGLRVVDLGDDVFYREIIAVSRREVRKVIWALLKDAWQSCTFEEVKVWEAIPAPEMIRTPIHSNIVPRSRRWGATPTPWDYSQEYHTPC